MTAQRWEFAPLRPLAYSVILADCPWEFDLRSEKGEQKSPQAHYRTIPDVELAQLPVGMLAAPDCLLFLWATWPKIDRALWVLKAWGFLYKTGGAWTKRFPSGKLGFGTGYILRSSCEPFLVGTIGRPQIGAKNIRNIIDSPTSIRREHSRKPDDQYQLLDQLVPNGARCELFARSRRPGWEAWGNQIDKFPAVAA